MGICRLNNGIPVCESLGKQIRPFSYNNTRYCSTCAVTFETSGKFCPCCGAPLRTRPHSKKGKEDWRKRLHQKITRF